MLGYAWQAGLVPISKDSTEAAIEANGAAITLNKRAFAWERLAALEPATVAQLAGLPESTHASREIEDETLAEGIARRSADLALYQDAGYADRFRHLKIGREHV